jgi:hypothetical protein
MSKFRVPIDRSTYTPVADRIALFYARYPGGRIITDLVSRDRGAVTFRARIYRSVADPRPAATGWAAEREGDSEINAVACLENAETSAIGRALGNLGFLASPTPLPVVPLPQRAGATMSSAANAWPADAHAKLDDERGRDPGPSQPPRRADAPTSTSGRAVTRPSVLVEVARASDLVKDRLGLLRTAERYGLSPARAAVVQAALLREPALPSMRLERLVRRLRHWLSHQKRRTLVGRLGTPSA